jgi:hypothetical protein
MVLFSRLFGVFFGVVLHTLERRGISKTVSTALQELL